MKLFNHILLFAATAMMLQSCADELSGNDWQPGASTDAPGVYFANENETFMTLLYGEGLCATLEMKRLETKGALTVEIIVDKANPEMVIPSSITFADGEDTAYLNIDCSKAPSETLMDVNLSLPDKYVNPYAAGAGVYEGQIVVSQWINVSETGLTDFTVVGYSSYKDEGYEPIESEMLHLLGTNRYVVKNFLNTGVDFNFELTPSKYKEGQYRIDPIGNQFLLADYGYTGWYNAWWFVSEDYDPDRAEDEDYDIWPNVYFTNADTGVETTVYYITFMWYDDATKADYCYVLNRDNGNPTAYMAFYGFIDEDMEKYAPYRRIRFAWKE